ncbi:MAG TPA: arginine deiminase-related protein [Gemmatimonadales bacterium]|nr:arginine deiminase-related protein [Gemmatimonadales bacterium]
MTPAAPRARAASHVLLVEPVNFRYNRETGATNAFQIAPAPAEEQALSELAVEQHHRVRDLLVDHGVAVTLTRSLPTSPDAPFCNNWFSTHPAGDGAPATMVLYPLLAENRRIERRSDLVALLRPAYPRLVDLSPNERKARFLESTGSLVLDHDSRTAYAALSPRTDFSLASEWAGELEYDLVAFTATDRTGVPFYHTNVLMFIGHGLAGICLESIGSSAERRAVEERLQKDGKEILPLTQEQTANFCGNCLALSSGDGTPLLFMSSQAWRCFSADQRATIERHGRILHTELSAFERLGGGSARCLVAELF